MMLIACPHCGPRAQEEFAYERPVEAVIRFADAPDDAVATLYARTNPRGVSEEIWTHSHGCRSWMVIRRDRVSHVIEWVRPLGPQAMP